MNDIILHHYPFSTFSEKVRTALGLKRLAWRSVEIAGLPPRPVAVSRKRARAASTEIETTPIASLLDAQTGPTAPLAYIAHLFEQLQAVAEY